MFKFIVMVITVILLVIAAVAGISYLGPAFLDSDGTRLLASYATQTLQVDGAYRAYVFDHGGAEPPGTDAQKITGLVETGYLAAIPDGTYVFALGKVYQDISTANQCVSINRASKHDLTQAASYGGCPPCNDPDYVGWPGCRRDPNDPSSTAPSYQQGNG